MKRCRWVDRTHGMTLAETVVVLSLFVVALSLITWLLERNVLSVRSEERLIDVERLALKALMRLDRESAGTPRAGCTILFLSGNPAGGDLALSCLTTRDPNGNYLVDPTSGQLKFQGYIIYYRKATDNTLRRVYYPLPSPVTIPQSLSPSAIPHIIANSGGGEVMVSGCSSFKAMDLKEEQVIDQLTESFVLVLSINGTNHTITYKLPLTLSW